jgi:hypothetical protein
MVLEPVTFQLQSSTEIVPTRCPNAIYCVHVPEKLEQPEEGLQGQRPSSSIKENSPSVVYLDLKQAHRVQSALLFATLASAGVQLLRLSQTHGWKRRGGRRVTQRKQHHQP